MKALVIYRNESPLHMGAGIEIGFVDMPIQREKSTGFPKMEASGIKGVFRERSDHKIWFGKEMGEEEGSNESGKICFTDARLLFLPIREGNGKLFVWVTCPFVLNRFLEEVKRMNMDFEGLAELSDQMKKVEVDEKTAVSLGIIKEFQNKQNLCLEELKFVCRHMDNLVFPELVLWEKTKNFLSEKMKQDLYLVDDTIFSYFCEMSTEVITRIRIGEDGIVKKGALFTEEFLPENSVLYNFIEDRPDLSIENSESYVKQLLEELESKSLSKTNRKQMNELETEYGNGEKNKTAHGLIQLGGGGTIGKGITKYLAHIKE